MEYQYCQAIISGGASGLGLATAKHIHAAGGRVAILDLDTQDNHNRLKQECNDSLFIPCDVTHEDQVDRAVQHAYTELGPITLAVNCAGIAPSQRVLGRDALMSSAEFSRVININLIGSFTVCRAVAAIMEINPAHKDQQRGVIINTASIAAFDGQIGQAAYAASKGGISSMTLPLAREFARIGVRVMTIAPGIFETPMFDSLPTEARNDLASNIPFPARLGQASEFAALVQHIYENIMLNGEVIRLDGALRMPPK